MTEFDDSGKPQDIPVRLKKAAWLTTFQVLSREHEVLRAMQDRAIAGYVKCKLCKGETAWFGDPAAAKIVLDYSRQARDDYKQETGESAPGDLMSLFAGFQAEDVQEVLRFVEERRRLRKLQEGEAPSYGAPPPPPPPAPHQE